MRIARIETTPTSVSEAASEDSEELARRDEFANSSGGSEFGVPETAALWRREGFLGSYATPLHNLALGACSHASCVPSLI